MICIKDRTTDRIYSRHKTLEKAVEKMNQINRHVPFGLSGIAKLDAIYWDDKEKKEVKI